MEGQLSLSELSAKFKKDSKETSRLAGLRAIPRSGTIRYRILQAIVAAGKTGLTDDDIADQLSLSPNTVRPRRLELVEGDWVCEGERAAQSFYGNKAIAWIATPRGVLAIEDRAAK